VHGTSTNNACAVGLLDEFTRVFEAATPLITMEEA
jgi:hypothetical protein